MISLNREKMFVAAVLRACVSKLSEWQVCPPTSLLAQPSAQRGYETPFWILSLKSNIILTETLDWQNSVESISSNNFEIVTE